MPVGTNGSPVGGTFTIHVGRGVSDRLPYNATVARAYAGFVQACARHDWLELPRWKRAVRLVLWGVGARP